jgi:hypothetical protein
MLTYKDENAKLKKILVCSFYSPPRSSKNQKCTGHVVTTLHMLSAKYPDIPIMMGAELLLHA